MGKVRLVLGILSGIGLTELLEIGVALTTFGAAFMFLGVMLFFDGALLALGNVRLAYALCNDVLFNSSAQILFLSGITLIIGPQKTFYFFARKQKIRGTVCFLGGILLVFIRWPFVGMIVETFGFLNLFGYVVLSILTPNLLWVCGTAFSPLLYAPNRDFFPVIVTFLRQLPFIGNVLTMPYIRDVCSLFLALVSCV
jgi:hypothetical protein